MTGINLNNQNLFLKPNQQFNLQNNQTASQVFNSQQNLSLFNTADPSKLNMVDFTKQQNGVNTGNASLNSNLKALTAATEGGNPLANFSSVGGANKGATAAIAGKGGGAQGVSGADKANAIANAGKEVIKFADTAVTENAALNEKHKAIENSLQDGRAGDVKNVRNAAEANRVAGGNITKTTLKYTAAGIGAGCAVGVGAAVASGALIGSSFPVVGTAIGAVVGAAVGIFMGASAKRKAKAHAKKITQQANNTGQMTAKFADATNQQNKKLKTAQAVVQTQNNTKAFAYDHNAGNINWANNNKPKAKDNLFTIKPDPSKVNKGNPFNDGGMQLSNIKTNQTPSGLKINNGAKVQNEIRFNKFLGKEMSTAA